MCRFREETYLAKRKLENRGKSVEYPFSTIVPQQTIRSAESCAVFFTILKCNVSIGNSRFYFSPRALLLCRTLFLNLDITHATRLTYFVPPPRESAVTKAGNAEADVSAGRGVKNTKTGTLEVMECDLGDLESVRAFARAFEEKHGRQLDVLVNNGERSASAFSVRVKRQRVPGVFVGYCRVEGDWRKVFGGENDWRSVQRNALKRDFW